uniref:Uncharacterized protein n=1 Tax=Poecilia mexicana TaxID=48701 RepID=A0A3B3Z4C8_9TELE
MGGQAKNKKKNKPKRKDNHGGFVDLSPQERMKVRMHEKAKKKTAEKYSVQQLLEKAGAAGTTDENDEVPSRKDVSVAYCSLAEIYLTDLCMEEGAADKCREFIEKALQYHHDNPEALQLMASYLFSTERNQEGKEYLLKSVGMWLPAQKQSAASTSTEEETQNEIPLYESRITTAKLLIESEEYEMAVDVLEGLLEEDDEVVQLYENIPFFSAPQQFPSFKHSHYLLLSPLQLYGKLRCDDQPVLEHAEQLLGELGGEIEEEDEDPAVDDDYEPCSDDEEEADAPMEH